ncbi:MAG: glycosyltransferase involved in cell wall biosynthesis [Paraglaciecola sp.]|jgi:glycosyltransferase involved in cell wall biosynthesis
MSVELNSNSTIGQVLVIGYVWPEPNSSAAGSHMLSFLKLFVKQGWQVTFASPAQLGEHKIDLTELGIEEEVIALNCSSFDEFIRQLNPDLVLFDRFMLEEQFAWRVAQQCPNAMRILDTEDLHSLRHARQQAHKQNRQVTKHDLHSDLALREIASIYRCDLSLIISDYELALLQNEYSVPEYLLHHCPFMLDLESLHTNPPQAEWQHRQHFISVGNFRHAPNWDAVLWLKQEIWPLIRKELPQAELHIYGAYPPPKATQLHNPKQGFLVKGWTPDAKQVMSQARVCLAPLRFGAGIKGKLAEAMLCGTPNVTTAIGSEGMHQNLPWSGEIADSAEQFATLAVALYQNQDRWQDLQQQGYTLLRQIFDQDILQSKLSQKIIQIKQGLREHRLQNFVGSMLQHHQHKSTQYMAQWIEAKNKC